MLTNLMKKYLPKGTEVQGCETAHSYNWSTGHVVVFDAQQESEFFSYFYKWGKNNNSYMPTDSLVNPLTEGQWFDFPNTYLKTLDDVSVFASKDETRYAICGIFIEKNAVTATDGHRLVTVDTNEFAPFLELVGIDSLILDPRMVDMLKVAKKAHGSITIARTDKGYRACLRTNEFIFWTNAAVIDGQFPDYLQVFPEYEHGTVKVPVEDPAKLAKGVKGKHFPLGFIDPEEKMILRTKGDAVDFWRQGYNSKGGKSEAAMASCFLSEDVPKAEVGVNFKYLAQALEDLAGAPADISLPLGDKKYLDPLLLTNGTRRHLIMPIRL